MSGTHSYQVAGLRDAAEIVVDRYGVPHIRAGSRRDLFFVQGFNAARDRLWQIDLWRKRGLGLLAADFGPGYLEQDRAARLFLYRGDMDAEWTAYGVPDLREIVQAFVEGINAFIALAEQYPELMPPEFGAMGTRPARWEAEDVVRIRSHALVANVLSEVLRAQVLAGADLETDLARRSIDPPHEIRVPEGLDPADISPRVLDVFKLATAPVTFSPERLAATLAEASRWRKVDELGTVFVDPSAPEDGSNNWAVAPSRSATGRPILGSDPHRVYALPSLRYLVHLTAPGLDLIGAGEPVLPGISFGHNGHSAFSMTIFPADQEDLIVYETDPSDPALYRYNGRQERLRELVESIPVKGAPDQEVRLRFTRHGPVVHEDHARNRAFAVRTVWLEPGSAAYLASVGSMEARTPEAFEQAIRHWSVPPANQVYSDASGNIAWFASAKVPRRPSHDGLLPIPGDGRYEWDGFHDHAELPRSVNPAAGFVATANEMNLPDGFPAEEVKIGYEWFEYSRADRIKAVLGADEKHTLDASMRLQTDDLSLPALRLLRLLGSGVPSPALELLSGWDGHLHEDSAAAALFEVWWTKHLKPALLARAAPDADVRALLPPGDHETLLAALEQPGSTPWSRGAKDREELLAGTLADAYAACQGLLSPDPKVWRWGSLHHGYFEHPLTAAQSRETAWRDVGPLPKGGSGSTVMNTRYRPSDFRAVSGASFRMILDVGNWDASRFINTPGQSGDPRSRHYDDLAPLWASRQYLPLLYTRDAVDEAAELRIALRPA